MPLWEIREKVREFGEDWRVIPLNSSTSSSSSSSSKRYCRNRLALSQTCVVLSCVWSLVPVAVIWSVTSLCSCCPTTTSGWISWTCRLQSMRLHPGKLELHSTCCVALFHLCSRGMSWHVHEDRVSTVKRPTMCLDGHLLIQLRSWLAKVCIVSVCKLHLFSMCSGALILGAPLICWPCRLSLHTKLVNLYISHLLHVYFFPIYACILLS